MSVNPISQRLPVFDLENPQGRQDAHRYVASGIVDLNQAIASLKTQLDAKAAASTITSSSTASTSSSGGVTTKQATTIANTQAAATIASTLGGVNQQATAAYTVQSSDYGGIIVQNSASASTITLNPVLPSQYFTAVENLGAGTVTLQPGTGVGGTGTINGAATLAVATGAAALIYYDGTNWWAIPVAASGGGGSGVISLNALSGALSIAAGSGITVTPAGSTITIAATGGGSYSLGGTLTSANVALGGGAGTGAVLNSVSGEDGNHNVTLTTGTSPNFIQPVYTLTFTTSRGRVTYPVTNMVPPSGTSVPLFFAATSSATGYVMSTATALTASTQYRFNVSCP